MEAGFPGAVKESFRLPQDVRPVMYNITLAPDFEKFTFGGYVDIEVEVLRPVSSLVMNAAELNIKSTSVTQGRKERAYANEITCDNEKETVTFEFDDPLDLDYEEERTHIEVLFDGTLNDNLCGFYRSKYTLPDGTERYMAATQFAAIDARRAFPCFDEPEQKAIFNLTLIVPEDRTAISNMPMRKEFSLGGGLKAVRFETTPKMSTYLLAFVVGDLESVESKTKNGTLVRVFATPGKKDQCAFALDVGVRVLEYFEDYFSIPYPLPKLYMAAIPDFEPGAMENWGLITFREVALLFDQDRSSSAAKQRVASIIAHELAHQWFGNLVTIKWWNDLWLNESFATFMGNKAVARLFPEWKVWDRFYTEDTAKGLSLDGLATSHPIEADIQDPKEIGQIFDAISYSKGAAVLRMLEDFLGEDPFREGVKQYLLAHQYKNAETHDLWGALEAVSGKPVGKIMDTWTKQTGYPVIEVSRFHHEALCGLELIQKRFLYNSEHPESKELWTVPLNISVRRGADAAKVLLKEPERKILMAASDRTPWIKVNSGQTGFFRVKYAQKMQEDLYSAIQRGELPTLDRMGLVNDAYALQRAGMVQAPQYLELVQRFANESEYAVWSEIASGLSEVMDLLTDEPYYGKLRELAKDVWTPLAQKMGWDLKAGEGELDPLLRSLALGMLARCKDAETIEEARQRFAMLCLDKKSLDPNLRQVVCNTSAQNGGKATYEALLKLYRGTDIKEEQMAYLKAMGLFRNKTLLTKTLKLALSSEVRLENAGFVIISVANNHRGRDLAWQFVKDNWEELHRRYEHSMFMLGRIIEGTVSGFRSEEVKAEVEQFFAEHPVPEASMALSQALERVDMNIAWLAHNRDSVGQWLNERKGTN